MDKSRVLFLSNCEENSKCNQNCTGILNYLKSLSDEIDLIKASSVPEAEVKLAETDVLVVWVTSKSFDSWRRLDSFMEKEERDYYVGFIVIFDIEEKDIPENVREALLRKVHTFTCPVNRDILKSCIKALSIKFHYKESLAKLKKELFDALSLDTIVERALQQLKEHPFIGYDRAAISLVDRKNKPFQRYLLKFDNLSDENTRPKRKLQKNIEDDQLIKQVEQKTTFIIDNLEALRRSEEGKRYLEEIGWDISEYATNDVNSWLGLAAKRQNETVAIFTLDSERPNAYDKNNLRLLEFLRDFGEIFADAVDNFLVRRNERILKKILNEMADDLSSEYLINQILRKLKYELNCDNCTYFMVKYDSNEKKTYLLQLTSAKDVLLTSKSQKTKNISHSTVDTDKHYLSNPENQSKKNIHSFPKGVGIVGVVLKEEKSRIVPHACEDTQFLSTRNHLGDKLSMLAVPVVPMIDEKMHRANRVIGVISCYKEEKPDHFTVYDRDLIEDIALNSATVIERTMILESLSDIVSKMTRLVIDPVQAEQLLKEICNFALNITSAGSASIHLLDYLQKQKKYIAREYPYYTYPEGIEKSPRLDGMGTTDLVIEREEAVEFSEELGNFGRVHEDQKKAGVKYKFVIPLIAQKPNSSIVGALYLNKYTEEPFSEVEKFALKLFADHAANIIDDQRIIADNKLMAEAHDVFKTAIEKISTREDIELLLKDVAFYSYSLIKESLSHLAISKKSINSRKFIRNSESNELLNDLVSYVVITNVHEKSEIKAAWPVYELINLKNTFDEVEHFSGFNKVKADNCNLLHSEPLKPKKKGITGLAHDRKLPVIIGDIWEDIKNGTEEGIQYIEFNPQTRSQLAIPIVYDSIDSGDSHVIGVINLEYSLPYAFNEIHQKVIENFAKHVAIAFQKKNLIDQISGSNKILTDLHQSLNQIVRESPQTMLYRAVSQTREVLGAKDVIVIPYKKNLIGGLVALEDAIVPAKIDRNLTALLDSISQNVLRTHVQQYLPNDENRNPARSEDFERRYSFSFGLCLPLISQHEAFAVMWILFLREVNPLTLTKNEEVYKVYANQIALAYANAQQYKALKNKSEEDLSKEIKVHRKTVLREAVFWFAFSLITALAGLWFIFSGVNRLFASDTKSLLRDGGLATGAGIVLQGVTILAFNQGKEANKRLDKYHQELNTVGQFNILLSAAEQLDPSMIHQEKQRIIQMVTNQWVQASNSENINLNKDKK